MFYVNLNIDTYNIHKLSFYLFNKNYKYKYIYIYIFKLQPNLEVQMSIKINYINALKKKSLHLNC
jgi:hypothetical protein